MELMGPEAVLSLVDEPDAHALGSDSGGVAAMYLQELYINQYRDPVCNMTIELNSLEKRGCGNDR